MRIVFFGSGAFGVPTLEALAGRHEIIAIVTRPDRPAGRRRSLTPTPIALSAREIVPSAPILKPEDANNEPVVDQIHSFDADALVVIAFGQKLRQSLLGDRFAINLHASRLPRWRGAAPINHAILAGDSATGNSVITLAQQMDAGHVLAQSEVPIDPLATAGDLHELLSLDGPPLVMDVLDRHAEGSLRPVEQDETRVTLAPRLSSAQRWLDLGSDSDECRRRINGLSPWPGISARIGASPMKLIRAQRRQPAGSVHQEQPGTILDASEGIIAAGAGTSLQLLEVQPHGKRVMSWKEFAPGRPIEPGASLEIIAP